MNKLTAALLLLGLTACVEREPRPARWERQCVASHDEPVATFYPDGNGNLYPMTIYNTVCDQVGIVCVAGTDGSTQCPDPFVLNEARQ